MLTLADRVILASGWSRRIIALLAGAFGALAMAPVSFGPALIVPMVVAVWLLDGSSEGAAGRPGRLVAWPGFGSLRLAFGAGWWLGFGYFLAGFWWLGAAFLAEPEFAWALPLGVVGVPFMLAFFPAVGFTLSRLLWAPGAGRIFALSFGLGLSEWLRGNAFTGFPWNAFGMALGGTLITAQTASLVGLNGLTMIAIALFAAPATLADSSRAGASLTLRPTLVAIAFGLILVGFGAMRLSQPPPATVPNVVVRIMQPGPLPNAEFRPENKDRILARYIELSSRDDAARGVKLTDVTLLVWPESAFPFILARDPRALSDIGQFLPSRTILVTGAAREEDHPAGPGRPAYSDYFNAIQAIGSGGTILDSYDKVHLVPFGEYLPFDNLIRKIGLRNFVAIPGGFESGTRRRPMIIPGLPSASPLICYEAIFPGSVLPDAGKGTKPRLLLNVTNDGWFGMTAGPSQHFAQARLRSIEEGLPMIRAAATGISAVIDPYGRIKASLALGQDGILDALLPEPISETIYARHRETTDLVVPLFMVLTSLVLRQRSRARASSVL